MAVRALCSFKKFISSKTLYDRESSYVLKVKVYRRKEEVAPPDSYLDMRVVYNLITEIRRYNLPKSPHSTIWDSYY